VTFGTQGHQQLVLMHFKKFSLIQMICSPL